MMIASSLAALVLAMQAPFYVIADPKPISAYQGKYRGVMNMNLVVEIKGNKAVAVSDGKVYAVGAEVMRNISPVTSAVRRPRLNYDQQAFTAECRVHDKHPSGAGSYQPCRIFIRHSASNPAENRKKLFIDEPSADQDRPPPAHQSGINYGFMDEVK